MTDSPHNASDTPSPKDTEHGEHYERIRDQLGRNRSRQFGLGGIFLLMAVVAGTLAWLRQSGESMSQAIVPLVVLLGVAISFTGLVMLLESPRQAAKGNRRLGRTYFWYGLAALLLGLPGGVLLAVAMFYVARA